MWKSFKNFSSMNLIVIFHLLILAPRTALALDVIIIGAGASGIAAASRLQSYGFNTTILEARGRIGGRVNTDTKTFGYPIDLGAIFITQQEDNPISKNANLYNLKQVPMDFGNVSPHLENNKHFHNAYDLYEKIFDKFINFCKNNYSKFKQYPVKEILNLFRKSSHFSTHEKIIINFVGLSFNFGLYRPLHDVKEFLFNGAVSFDSPGGLKMTADGLVKTLEPMVKHLNIQFNTIIASIDYSLTLDKNKVIITDHKGNQYKCDYVVVTVPLGYLKKNLLKFTPDLTAPKKEAIQKLAFFNMNKIFVEFEEKFWPDNDFITFFNEEGIINMAANMYKVYKNSKYGDKNTLMFFVVEDTYNILKNKTAEQVKDIILNELKKTFPDSAKKIEINKLLMTNWNDDPYTYGSFTEVAGHEYLRRRFEIPEGAQNRLIFAGEHTSPKFNAYVYGAYMSGVRAADQIKKFANKLKILNKLFKCFDCK